MAKNKGERTLVYVQLAANRGNLKYAFPSGLKSSLRDNFGHVVVTADTPVANLAIGVNFPKPDRATRKTKGIGFEGSFCADNKISALKQSGFRIVKSRASRRVINNSLVATVYVTINGLKYAWNFPKDASAAKAVAALGIEVADKNDKGLIFGASWPRPGVYKIQITGENSSASFSSFCDPSKEDSLEEDWEPGAPRISLDPLTRK